MHAYLAQRKNCPCSWSERFGYEPDLRGFDSFHGHQDVLAWRSGCAPDCQSGDTGSNPVARTSFVDRPIG